MQSLTCNRSWYGRHLQVATCLSAWFIMMATTASTAAFTASSSYQRISSLFNFKRHRRHFVRYHDDNQIFDRSILELHSTSQLPQQLQGCSVEVMDSSTGVQIVLLGCFHGSRSSAMDVQHALSSSTTTNDVAVEASPNCQVIVLELCAQRFADLRRDIVKTSVNNNSGTNLASTDDSMSEGMLTDAIVTTTTSSERLPWIWRYTKRIRQTCVEQGWPAAVTAAILGGVSGLQTAVSSLQPGLEFTTALQIAQQHSIDIVLADQAVDRTLTKMGHIFSTSLDLWKEWWITGSWDQTFGQEATALRNALMGESRPIIHGALDGQTVTEQVSFVSFLTRNDAAIQDLFRLVVPPFLILQAFNVIFSQWLGSLFHPVVGTGIDSNSLFTSTLLESDPGWIPIVMINVVLLTMGYLSVALPATRIIIRERDDILTQGILKACQLAQQKQTIHSNTACSPRVVAVLGLLHVNGIAQRLVENNRKWEESNII